MSDFDPFAATIFADHGYRALPGQKHSLVMNPATLDKVGVISQCDGGRARTGDRRRECGAARLGGAGRQEPRRPAAPSLRTASPMPATVPPPS